MRSGTFPVVLAVCQSLVIFAALSSAQSPPPTAGLPGIVDTPAPDQPIPFSHKLHISQGLTCEACHETAYTNPFARLPTTSSCMGCHTTVKADSPVIQTLTKLDAMNIGVQWKRVYRIPTFAHFSHVQHVDTAGVSCEICHGDVAEMDVMRKVRDNSMKACLACHKSAGAKTECDTCHEPKSGQP